MQVRVTGAEVIYRHLVTRMAKRLNDRRGFRNINKPTLGYFNFNLFCAYRMLPGFIGNKCNREEWKSTADRLIEI